jgi:hypothetical protein
MSELSELGSMRLQMAMDRISKMAETPVEYPEKNGGDVRRDQQEHQIVLPLLLIPVLFWRFVFQSAIGRTFKILELA